jgi:ketosteroid isomerase-like protein
MNDSNAVEPVSDFELALVQEGYRAFERGDLPWVLEHFAEDILVEDRFESPDSATFRGHDGFLEYLQGWLSAWDEFRMEPDRFIVAGPQVLVLLRQFGRCRGSTIEVEERVAHLWTVEDGKASAYRVYTHQREALASVLIDGQGATDPVPVAALA